MSETAQNGYSVKCRKYTAAGLETLASPASPTLLPGGAEQPDTSPKIGICESATRTALLRRGQPCGQNSTIGTDYLISLKTNEPTDKRLLRKLQSLGFRNAGFEVAV